MAEGRKGPDRRGVLPVRAVEPPRRRVPDGTTERPGAQVEPGGPRAGASRRGRDGVHGALRGRRPRAEALVHVRGVHRRPRGRGEIRSAARRRRDLRVAASSVATAACRHEAAAWRFRARSGAAGDASSGRGSTPASSSRSFPMECTSSPTPASNGARSGRNAGPARAERQPCGPTAAGLSQSGESPRWPPSVSVTTTRRPSSSSHSPGSLPARGPPDLAVEGLRRLPNPGLLFGAIGEDELKGPRVVLDRRFCCTLLCRRAGSAAAA
jgi:hypothetical protein